MALTDRAIKNAKPKSSVYRIREAGDDPELKGFGVTVAPAGTKTFFLNFTSPVSGKRRQVNLGRYPAVGLKEARQKAREARAGIALGRDPADEQVEAAAITLAESLDKYARARLDHQRTGHETERALRRDFFTLLDRPVTTIAPPMLAAIIDAKVQSAPTMSNRLVAYSRPWFRWLVTRGHIANNPMEGIEKPTREIARERLLNSKEIAAIWQATPSLGYPFGPLVRLLLLIGVRREELAGMRRDEIDFDKKLWSLPAARSKTGTTIRIPLSDAALEVLHDIPRVSGKFVFSTTGKTPVSGFSKMKRKLDKLSGVSDWRLHDFRRTMVSAMVDFGIDATTADRCLNHTGAATMSTVQRIYQRSELLEQRRHALEKWAHHVDTLVSAGAGPAATEVQYNG